MSRSSHPTQDDMTINIPSRVEDTDGRNNIQPENRTDSMHDLNLSLDLPNTLELSKKNSKTNVE